MWEEKKRQDNAKVLVETTDPIKLPLPEMGRFGVSGRIGGHHKELSLDRCPTDMQVAMLSRW